MFIALFVNNDIKYYDDWIIKQLRIQLKLDVVFAFLL